MDGEQPKTNIGSSPLSKHYLQQQQQLYYTT